MENKIQIQDTITDDDFHKWSDHVGCGLMKLIYRQRLESIYINSFLLELHRYSQDEFVEAFQRDPTHWMHPDDAKKIKAYMTRQRNLGDNIQFECRAARKDNTYLWVYVNVHINYLADACVVYCTVFDIAGTKYTLSHLMKAKNDLDVIANSIPGGIVKLDSSDFKIIYASDGFFRQSGLSRYEYQRKHQNVCTDVIHPDDLPMVLSTCEDAACTGEGFSIEIRIVRDDGEIRWSLVNGTPIREEGFDHLVLICVITDITSSKRQLQSLEMWEKRALNITQIVGEILWEYNISKDTMSRYGELSETYSSAPTLKHYHTFLMEHNILHPDDVTKFQAFFEKLSSGHKTLRLDVRMKDHLGIYTWTKLHGMTFYDEAGQPVRIFGKTQNMERQNYNLASDAFLLKKERELMESVDDLLLDLPSNAVHGMMLIDFDHPGTYKKTYGTEFLYSILKNFHYYLENSYPGILSGTVSDHASEAFPPKITNAADPFSMIVFFPMIASEETLMEAAVKLKNFLSADESASAAERLSVSIGLTFAAGQEVRYEIMKKQARIALCSAKNKGDGQWDIYGQCGNRKVSCAPEAATVSLPDEQREDYKLLQEIGQILFQSQELSCRLEDITRSLSAYFKASVTAWMEFSPKTGHCYLTHCQYAPNVKAIPEEWTEFPTAAVKNLSTLFTNGPLCLCKDLTAITEAAPLIGEGLRLSGIHSLLMYAFRDENKLLEILMLGSCENDQLHSEEDIGLFRLIGNLLQPFILNQRKHQLQILGYANDEVTGLFNFSYFIKHANEILLQQRDSGSQEEHFALLYADVSNFKAFNSNYGFSAGNQILEHFGHSLRRQLRKNEIASRIYNDHFVILLHYDTEQDLFSRLNHRIINNVQMEEISRDYFRFDTVFGVYLIPEGETNITYMLDKANLARKSIKMFPGSNYAVYTPEMSENAAQEELLASEIEDALKNREFIPYFQPIYDTKGTPVMAEALARWVRPSGETLVPEEFLSILDKKDLTSSLDFYMLKQTGRILRSRLDSGEMVLPISFNLTEAHLKTPDFIEHMMRIINRYQIPIEYLMFEIKEETFLKHPSRLPFLLNELNSYGIRILLDNLSPHHFTPSLIKDFDLYGVKIDAGESAAPKNRKERVIFSKLIELCRDTGLKVFCENIENAAHNELCLDTCCQYFQGNYYFKPLSKENFIKRIL